MIDDWHENFASGLDITYDAMDKGIGYIPVQVVAEIRDKNKPSKRANEIASLYDLASDEEKRKVDEILCIPALNKRKRQFKFL